MCALLFAVVQGESVVTPASKIPGPQNESEHMCQHVLMTSRDVFQASEQKRKQGEPPCERDLPPSPGRKASEAVAKAAKRQKRDGMEHPFESV